MAVTSWLIDKSAYARLATSPDAATWLSRINRGLVRVSTITRLEIGFSFRTGDEGRRETSSPPLALLPIVHLTPTMEDRAIEVQMLLADRGQHRAPSIPDLLVAATAEKSGMTVLAVDKDFGLIAGITGQPVETLTQA